MSDKTIPVRVAVRCRPLVESEIRDGCQSALQFPAGSQVIAGSDKVFSYDYVFQPSSSQSSVYDLAVNPLLDNLFKGYNATVLAYGQTGSGKTFTMGGGADVCACSDEHVMGIIPRVINVLFARVQDDQLYNYTIRVSYLELYHDDLNDLLVPPADRVKDSVQIREESAGGIRVTGAVEKEVKSASELLQCLLEGSQGRSTGSTAMNSQSSRSHAIFTITVDKFSRTDSDDFCRSKFHLVDLAGSERAKKTQATGERFKEGVSINKGLLALGNVISALGEETGKKDRHIPYRDSKLTRLLQDSLGGNSHTLMIACVSPADSNVEETVSTLRYADRARKIKNKPVVNRDPQAAEILRLRQLVQELMSSGKTVGNNADATTATSQAHAELTSKVKALQEENRRLLAELQQSVDQNAVLCDRLVTTEITLDKMREAVDDVKRKLHTSMMESCQEIEGGDMADEAHVTLLKDMHSQLNSILVADDVEHKVPAVNGEDSFSYEAHSASPDGVSATREHVERQARLGKELQQLTQLMCHKQQLAQQLQQEQDSGDMHALREKYERNMKQLTEEVEKLQKEREELSDALHQAKLTSVASKLSEQRRKRLMELEAQLISLRKQIAEQSRVAKLKEQTDKQAEKLAAEILAMKQQRVRLVKQMKLDADNFTKFKQDTEKQVVQLKAQERKRQVEVARLVQKNNIQEAVLKRKAEEAAAAHRRLKEVLMKQKTASKQRQGQQEREEGGGLGARVKKWLADELEVMVSVEEAKQHLQQLMADRKELAEQLRVTKAKLEGRLPTKKKLMSDGGPRAESTDPEITDIQQLQREIDLRNAQISEMNAKILESDQDNSHWAGIHSMAEAKCAVKQLLSVVVGNQLSSSEHVNKIKDEEMARQQVEEVLKELRSELSEQRHRHDTEMITLRRECEERVSCLLEQLSAANTGASANIIDSRTVTKQRSKSRLSKQDENRVSEENKALRQELTVLKYKFRCLGKSAAINESLMPAVEESFFSPAHGVHPLTEEDKTNRMKADSDHDQSDSDSGREDPEWCEGNTPGFHMARGGSKTRNTRKRKTLLQKSKLI